MCTQGVCWGKSGSLINPEAFVVGPSRRWLARPQRVFYCLPCSHCGSGQSGRGADDPRGRISATSAATSALIDLVHDEVVYRREVMRTPVRALATEIGVSKSAVDKFHKLRTHPGKLWPKLRGLVHAHTPEPGS